MERYRIVEGVGLYDVTFTVVEWLPVFIDETACRIITDSFNFCVTNKHFTTAGFTKEWRTFGCAVFLEPPHFDTPYRALSAAPACHSLCSGTTVAEIIY